MSVQPYIRSYPLSPLPNISPAQVLQEDVSSDCMQHILHLLWVGQTLSRETTGVVERLCQEVERITHGKAWLILRLPDTATKVQVIVPNALISFSVQFDTTVYGTLCIASSSTQPTSPALPFSVGQLIAQVCSWLLFTFEQSVFLRNQCQRFTEQPYGVLTRREREVLTLMCLGYDQKSIADHLCISPTTVSKHRQHIYEQLGVHNEHDAQLAAYHLGLFSILEQVAVNYATNK